MIKEKMAITNIMMVACVLGLTCEHPALHI